MACRTFTVLVDWADNHVEDTDEIQVTATAAAAAIAKAKVKWMRTIGRQYRYCRITRIRILTERLLRQLA